MKVFLGWLEHLVMLSAVIGVVAWIVACITGDGISDGELNFFGKAFAVWFLAVGVGYILSPEPPNKRRRRR